MKKLFTLLIIVFSLSSCDTLNQIATQTGSAAGISNAEAGSGIKEALAQGIVKSVLRLNSPDGFFKDALYKVLLPPDALKIENTLRSLGFNNLVDKAILQINRGAEDAAGYAKPIFVDAIKSMTLNDAIGLIRNGDTSATHFFREKTTDKLIAAFSPVIKSSLDRTEATKYYSEMVTKYNNLPIVFKKVNPDLTGYVTEKATGALFSLIAKEEVNIRSNIAARTTDLLKKVFGGAYK
jgi:predicted S18 family serine protease